MLLYELLEFINDNSIVRLYDCHAECIATYDGKDSIDEKFNEREVWDIHPSYELVYFSEHKKTYLPIINIDIDWEVDA